MPPAVKRRDPILRELAERGSGEVIGPEDHGYSGARTLWNAIVVLPHRAQALEHAAVGASACANTRIAASLWIRETWEGDPSQSSSARVPFSVSESWGRSRRLPRRGSD